MRVRDLNVVELLGLGSRVSGLGFNLGFSLGFSLGSRV